MSYIRVLPRDLFNEANLLKCAGALWIATENNRRIRFSEDDVRAFDIDQDTDDGSLTITNIQILIDGDRYDMRRPLNSREPWPLYLRKRGEWDDIAVFNDDGSLSDELRAMLA